MIKYIKLHSAKFFVLLFAWLLCQWFLLGEDKDQKPFTHPTFVDVVVVQGEAVEKTATVTLVTAEEIKEKGIKTAAEALETIPGLHVRVGGKGEAYVRLRGFRQREIALLVDGVPVSSPYDGQLDLSSLPVESVERIEVVKGASSVLYGSNAMGGVINIITRKSNGANHFSVNGEVGAGNTRDFNAAAQGSLGKIRYFVSGGYFNQDNYPLSDDYQPQTNQGVGELENSHRKGWDGSINLGWDMGKTAKAAVNFRHIDLERGLPHHESDKKAKFWRFTDWREGVLDFIFDKSFARSSLKSKVYYQYFTNVLDSYDDRTYTTQDGKSAFTDTLDDYALGGDVFYRVSAGKNLLLKSALRFNHAVHRQQKDVGEDWNRYEVSTLSLPLEGEWSPLKGLTFTGGASFDVMFFEKEAVEGRETTTAINPQVAALVEPLPGLLLKASASRKTRFPSMKELFSTTSGNPGLEPMKSDSFELGGEYRVSEKLTLSLVGFYNNVTDLINRIQKNDPYINIDHAVFKGFEAGAQWRFAAGSYFSLAYTRLSALDKTSKEQDYIQYRPGHKVDSYLTIKLPARFMFNITGSWVSSQRYYDGDGNECTLDPYTVIDFKLTKRVGKKLELYLGARNLFDVDYYESEGYPREGRMLYGGIRFEVY
jgi:outer membrane cobalamin receptor